MIYGCEIVLQKQSHNSEPRISQCGGVLEVSGNEVRAYGNVARMILKRILSGKAVRGEHFLSLANTPQWKIKLPVVLNNEYNRIISYNKIPDNLDLQMTVNINTGIVEEFNRNGKYY